jgi:hypothetical protein
MVPLWLPLTQPPALLPTWGPLLVRTDFSDERAWDSLCEGIRTESVEGFLAAVDIVNDQSYSNMTSAELRGLLPDHGRGPYFFFVADHDAIASAGHPILVVPVPYPEPEFSGWNEVERAEFRVIVTKLWSVENNLSISNMDWADFAGNVAEDGVFRGF